jgi:hypothetical protein
VKLIRTLGAFTVGAAGSWFLVSPTLGAAGRAASIRRLVIPSGAAEFWSLVTGLATVGLIYVAYRGLRSIRLAQRDMVNRATRDALECAVRRCEEFAERIISLNGEILNGLAAGQVPVFVQNMDEVRFDPDNAEDIQRAKEWWAGVPSAVRVLIITLLNRMEAWSMYLNVGLAESTIVHAPCSAPFLGMVVQCYAPILLMRNHASAGNYPNLVKVYTAWKTQLDVEKKNAEQKDLLGRLGELMESRRFAAHNSLPKPIGTAELD